MSLIGYIISLIFGVIELLLSIRFIFLLFGANTGNAFVSWLYQNTNGLVSPFIGIFSPPPIGIYIDVPTILAILIYGFIGYLLGRVLFPSH